jgi:hypothetical protein
MFDFGDIVDKKLLVAEKWFLWFWQASFSVPWQFLMYLEYQDSWIFHSL